MPVPADRVTLERALGPGDGATLVISNVIGVGIFTAPGLVAQLVPHPLALLGVWLVGGALALAGASAYAELAALRPRAGGDQMRTPVVKLGHNGIHPSLVFPAS